MSAVARSWRGAGAWKRARACQGRRRPLRLLHGLGLGATFAHGAPFRRRMLANRCCGGAAHWPGGPASPPGMLTTSRPNGWLPLGPHRNITQLRHQPELLRPDHHHAHLSWKRLEPSPGVSARAAFDRLPAPASSAMGESRHRPGRASDRCSPTSIPTPRSVADQCLGWRWRGTQLEQQEPLDPLGSWCGWWPRSDADASAGLRLMRRRENSLQPVSAQHPLAGRRAPIPIFYGDTLAPHGQPPDVAA